MRRRSLVVLVVAAVAAAVVTPLALARAGEGDGGAGHPSGQGSAAAPAAPADAGLAKGFIDLTGGTPAAQQDGVAAFEGTGVPGLAKCRQYKILSLAANRYIAEEQSLTGTAHNMLRARTAPGQTGAWEVFEICSDDGGHLVHLRAASNYLVTAEFAYTGRNTGMLRGRGEWTDIWETFDVWTDAGKYYLRNVSRGTYFTCRLDYTGQYYQEMKATGSAPGAWEALWFDAI
ncbi:fascin domain-containing protein [Dactylosporangium sp. NPDC051541]|uniref:fascin domain-containing protein n=1 Tax=Dactylosporangium sp. NPDC051541 TaxID=3363977 RepID=UPI0037A0C9B0